MSEIYDGTTKLYAERHAFKQGQHYLNHVLAMTAEGLHSKSDIAAELAHRDIEIEALAARLAEAEALLREVTCMLKEKDYVPAATENRIDAFLTPAASAYDKYANMLDLTPVGPGRTVDDALTDQPRVCPHYDMVIVNEPGCPDCAADQPSEGGK